MFTLSAWVQGECIVKRCSPCFNELMHHMTTIYDQGGLDWEYRNGITMLCGRTDAGKVKVFAIHPADTIPNVPVN